MGDMRRKRRVNAYVAAAREVRDHEGNVVLSKDEAMASRLFRMQRALGHGITDPTGIGFGKPRV